MTDDRLDDAARLRLLEAALEQTRAAACITTAELDEAAEKFIRSQGGEPSFKGYRGFPGSICASPRSLPRVPATASRSPARPATM